ncbi:GNAT family N-acetyltransferase [Ulvibacter antarcticus]|uniref:RimJ/RimL family protein N-acetyltransferase n=1 Tax=Ulvibacter antarcticus TaxID=442714 RepID=A0A3L9ZDW5_9FLAO|nr:GNAT family N-acetyltransferase [Ulvibacter antarcticus]RMA64862.1 RimJ/RimL family protein N-acetyltransferase [Ulvibacter antarcticus]
MILLETERLQLRQFTLDDAPFTYELLNTPEWLKYIGDRKITSVEVAAKYIEEHYLSEYKDNGYGAYIIVRKEDGVILGSCGLYKREALEHPDMGFAMFSRYGKKGYAFEATNALMEHAKNTLKLSTIWGITVDYNHNSIKLLQKLGMKQIDVINLKDDPEDLLLFST